MASIDALVCRRSPHLVCYWRGADYIIENFATGIRVFAPALTANVLGFFDDWRLVHDFLAASPVTTRHTLRTLLRTLVRHSLLQRRDRAPSSRERAMDAWQPWNPAAGFFHTTTKDMSFLDMDTQVKHLRAKSRTVPMPESIKRITTRRRFPFRRPRPRVNSPACFASDERGVSSR